MRQFGTARAPESAAAREPITACHGEPPGHKRRLPIIGKGEGVTSHIHVDDAAAATVTAIERGSGRAAGARED